MISSPERVVVCCHSHCPEHDLNLNLSLCGDKISESEEKQGNNRDSMRHVDKSICYYCCCVYVHNGNTCNCKKTKSKSKSKPLLSFQFQNST